MSEGPDRAASGARSRAARLRTAGLVAAPLAAVVTLMLGLRVGAGEAVRGVVVFTAPPGKVDRSGTARTAFQLLTVLDDRGVRETVPMRGLVADARDPRGRTASWRGASNEDGVAELTLAWEGTPEAPVHLRVGMEGDPLPLAEGDVGWTAQPVQGATRPARPSRRDGDLPIDVLVEGERLVPGFASDVWLRLGTAGELAVTLDPEPGLRTEKTPTRTCPVDRATPGVSVGRWAHVSAVAEAHVTALTVEARSGEHHGTWAGQVPVAPGAFFASLPRVLPVGEATEVVLVAPNPRTVVYAEIDDVEGRVFAAALPVTTEAGDPVPRARLAIPPLGEGPHWLVVSGEPHGAERLEGATVARPFLVRGARGDDVDPCVVGPIVVQHPARGFPRTATLDGLPARSAKNRARRMTGLGIALGALACAAVVDVLLLAQIAREARARLAAAAGDEAEVVAPRPGTTLAIALSLTVLGFLLLAALVVAKS